jgi:hypothetical protein
MSDRAEKSPAEEGVINLMAALERSVREAREARARKREADELWEFHRPKDDESGTPPLLRGLLGDADGHADVGPRRTLVAGQLDRSVETVPLGLEGSGGNGASVEPLLLRAVEVGDLDVAQFAQVHASTVVDGRGNVNGR